MTTDPHEWFIGGGLAVPTDVEPDRTPFVGDDVFDPGELGFGHARAMQIVVTPPALEFQEVALFPTLIEEEFHSVYELADPCPLGEIGVHAGLGRQLVHQVVVRNVVPLQVVPEESHQ